MAVFSRFENRYQINSDIFMQNGGEDAIQVDDLCQKASGEDRASPKSPMGSLLHYVVVESEQLTNKWSVSVSIMLEMISSLSSASVAFPKKIPSLSGSAGALPY